MVRPSGRPGCPARPARAACAPSRQGRSPAELAAAFARPLAALLRAQLRTAATRTFRLRFQLGLVVSCHDIAVIWVAFFSRWQQYRGSSP